MTTLGALRGLLKLEKLEVSTSTLNGSFPSGTEDDPVWNLPKLSIMRLSCAMNNIEACGFQGIVPETFGDFFPLLKELRLEQLGLTLCASEALSRLSHLEFLSFSGSKAMLGDLGSLRSSLNLTWLSIDNTELSARGPELMLPKLSHIDLSSSSSRWSSLYWDKVSVNLRYLSLSKTSSFGDITAGIGRLTRLEYLDISDTLITGSLPPEIGKCLSLKEIIIALTPMVHPIPNELMLLNRTLTKLILENLEKPASMRHVALPEAIGKLICLTSLRLASSNFQGTIPASYGLLPQLTYVSFANNILTGSLPEFLSPDIYFVDARNNDLTGLIPLSLSSTTFLSLRNNRLGPSLPDAILNGSHRMMELDFSHNAFSGPLPHFSLGQLPYLFDLSYNEFDGSIPASYCGLQRMTLSHNRLSGPITQLFNQTCYSGTTHLFLDHNRLNGTIPSLVNWTQLHTIEISNNEFDGAVPLIPSRLNTLHIANNRFDTASAVFESLRFHLALEKLDISNNPKLKSLTSWLALLSPNLKYLSTVNIQFGGLLPTDFNSSKTHSLLNLDVSNTNSVGTFHTALFPNLVELRIAHNRFNTLNMEKLASSIAQLDISDNEISFDFSSLSEIPLLTNFNARSNKLYGTFYLDMLPKIQTIDVSHNQLHREPDYVSISSAFTQGSLQLLNISRNPLPLLASPLDNKKTGLSRSNSSGPSIDYPDVVTCYAIAFHGQSGKSFVYDESLFDYSQCDCNSDYFGLPPHECHPCPNDGTKSCGATQVTVNSHQFVFSTAMERVEAAALSEAPHDDPKSTSRLKLEIQTEPCTESTIQALTGLSNCKGLQITAKILSNTSDVLTLLESQCGEGSTGRLCSKCICHAHSANGNVNSADGSDGEAPFCYFEKGPVCAKCSRVLRPAQFLPLLIGLIIATFIALSLVMLLILQSKRSQKLIPWPRLPLLKRILYRLVHFTTLGNISILITFVQMLITFTQWDVYIKARFLSVLNADPSGYVILATIRISSWVGISPANKLAWLCLSKRYSEINKKN